MKKPFDLNANLFFTRLTGHGRNQKAMELCSIPNWMKDLHEAIEIGSKIGEKIVKGNHRKCIWFL